MCGTAARVAAHYRKPEFIRLQRSPNKALDHYEEQELTASTRSGAVISYTGQWCKVNNRGTSGYL